MSFSKNILYRMLYEENIVLGVPRLAIIFVRRRTTNFVDDIFGFFIRTTLNKIIIGGRLCVTPIYNELNFYYNQQFEGNNIFFFIEQHLFKAISSLINECGVSKRIVFDRTSLIIDKIWKHTYKEKYSKSMLWIW